MVKVRSGVQWVGAAGSACLALAAVGIGLNALGAVVLVGSLVLIAFWLRTPLEVGDDEILVRRFFGTRRLPRSEVVGADTMPVSGWPAWRQLRLRLADGSFIDVERVAQVRTGGAVDRAREVLAL